MHDLRKEETLFSGKADDLPFYIVVIPDVPQLERIPFELVLNTVPLENVIPELDIRIVKEQRNYINIMTHEPQFYPYYWNCIGEHWQRLDTAFAHLTACGYTPVWGSLIEKADL